MWERPEGSRGGSHLPATPTFGLCTFLPLHLPCRALLGLLSCPPAQPSASVRGVALVAPRPHARKIHSSLTQGVPTHPLPLALTTLSTPSGGVPAEV